MNFIIRRARKMKQIIIREPKNYPGCDFVVELGKDRKETPVKLLQLTDMQIIDAEQRRRPDRISSGEIAAWQPEKFMDLFGNHALSLAAQTKPDLIFITGDLVYGQFDDKGTTFEWFCSFMESLDIPWAPVFGNHDNESQRGVDWQCDMLENSKNCLFKRGEVDGHGNYSVGITVDGELVRVLHMADSHGCLRAPALTDAQLELISSNTAEIKKSQGKDVPAFMAFHIPTELFDEAERAKGYTTDEHPFYAIGVDAPQKGNDFGFSYEVLKETIHTERDFVEFLHEQNIDGVFTGHWHNKCTCIDYHGVKLVFGLKTGQYDYHIAGSIGGTLVTLCKDKFDVCHIPSLVPFAPMARNDYFKNFFVKE